MKLRRIQADAFGALRDRKLDGLGDGLTVVLGPNEAGKTTFAALVRQVLYGFAPNRGKERNYMPTASGRAGSLLFEDATGQWVLSRTEAVRGGTVRVDALSGDERNGLLQEIVGSVSEQTFRVVFGFGLDELAQIEKGDDKAIIDRLYAGSTGLDVNPMDVREQLNTAAANIFKPGGSKAELNEALRRIRETSSSARDIVSRAKEYAAEQSRLQEVEERLEPLRERRDELDRARLELERDLERARGVERERLEARDRVAEVTAERDDRQREAAKTTVDEHLLAISADIESLLEEASGAKQRAEHARSLESRIAEAVRSAQVLPAAPANIDVQAARAAVEARRDRAPELLVRLDTATANAQATAAAAAAYEAAGAQDVQARPAPIVPILTILVGVVAAVAGGLAREWIAVGAGAIVLALGVVLLLTSRRAKGGSLGVDAARLRAEATAAAEVAQKEAERSAAESAAWKSWLEEHGLDSRGEQPQAVSTLLDDIQRRLVLEDQIASMQAEAARERAAATEWGNKLVALLRGPLGISESSPEPHALAIRGREALTNARSGQEAKQRAIAAVHAAEVELKRLADKDVERNDELARIAHGHGLESDVIAGLEALLVRVGQDLAEAVASYEACANEQATLAGMLATVGKEDELARLRQQIEGARADAFDAADRYLVEALAVGLIDRARERFERDRQPDVVHVAERVYERMTGGAYTNVVVPLDRASITVVSASGQTKPTSILSRGAVEQLYLALRVGLIESFGEQAPHLPVLMDDIIVNYDSERMGNASAAIQALTEHRQVIFFTCHDATASALSAAIPGTVTLELERVI